MCGCEYKNFDFGYAENATKPISKEKLSNINLKTRRRTVEVIYSWNNILDLDENGGESKAKKMNDILQSNS